MRDKPCYLDVWLDDILDIIIFYVMKECYLNQNTHKFIGEWGLTVSSGVVSREMEAEQAQAGMKVLSKFAFHVLLAPAIAAKENTISYALCT
jgi:hypothetical protein